MNCNIKCTCGHQDDFTAFETSTNGVWKCLVCGNVEDTRENYKDDEHFMDIMDERAELKAT